MSWLHLRQAWFADAQERYVQGENALVSPNPCFRTVCIF